MMPRRWCLVGAVAVVLAASACGSDGGNDTNATGNAANEVQAAAPRQSIADGLNAGNDGRFRAAVDAAGLTATLAGPGEYTVLVPGDAAFERLPAGTLDGLMQPSARERLTEVITYHVLPGAILAADLGRAIDTAGGRAVLATMNGSTLTATRDGEAIVLADAAGTTARIGAADQRFKNGVAHRIDAVLIRGS